MGRQEAFKRGTHIHICMAHGHRQECGEGLRWGRGGRRGQGGMRDSCNTVNNKENEHRLSLLEQTVSSWCCFTHTVDDMRGRTGFTGRGRCWVWGLTVGSLRGFRWRCLGIGRNFSVDFRKIASSGESLLSTSSLKSHLLFQMSSFRPSYFYVEILPH